MNREGNRLAFIACAWSIALLLASFALGCTSNHSPGHDSFAAEKLANDPGPTSKIPPASIGSAVAHTDLTSSIDSQIDDSDSAFARWGVCVISLNDGQTLYSRNADKLFTPASNMKIYTTGVALDLLGADYRWRTSVYANSQPDASGTVNGDLVLYGRGAPDLVSQNREDNSASLSQLAEDLYKRGLRRVRGNVIGDESYFRGDALGDGWQWTDVQWYFGAEPSALSINGNEIDVNILTPNKTDEPPVVNVSGTDGYVTLQNRMVTIKRGERLSIGIERGLSDNGVRVWGEFPLGSKGYGARLSLHNPALSAANLFVSALKAHGITIDGAAQSRDSRAPRSERFDPSRATELAFVSSKPLSEIVKTTNKESVNLDAELILRTLGRERSELLPAPEPSEKERGDDEAGAALIRLWLSRAGISTQNIAVHDGSGLSRLDLVTPESTTRLLVAISKTAASQIFRDSLPISGRDGTLRGRLKTLTDRVSAKTGSLTYDNSLSGYVTASNGQVLVFSVMCNDQTGRMSSTRVIDQIVSILAAYPHSEVQK
jgi:D-alanyl-D-alanine carboxypeptidase/D-alanyl-D-alanine-endopeptidase (penicillin-binding protein 4)